MFNKISGVPNNCDEARQIARDQRANYDQYTQQLKYMKSQYHELKNMNEMERARLKKEEKMAQSFKFTKMSKKTPFLPSLHQKGELQPTTSFNKNTEYADYRDREKLIFPDRISEKVKKWQMNQTSDGGIFQRAVKQEEDVYDDVLLRYMRKLERGMSKPTMQEREEGLKAQQLKLRYRGQSTSGTWAPNTFYPSLLNTVQPLLDRTNTPRGAMKAITLERTFDKEKWLYNKNKSDLFTDSEWKKDKERGKALTKKKRKSTSKNTTKMSKAVSTSSAVSNNVQSGQNLNA